MELTSVIYKEDAEFAIHADDNAKLYTEYLRGKLTPEEIVEAEEYIQELLVKLVMADKPFVMDPVSKIMMFNEHPEPFLSDYIQVAQILDAGLAIHYGKENKQYFLPTDVVINPMKYFDKITPSMYALKGTKEVFPDIVALWGSLEDNHPLMVIDKPVTFKSSGIKYKIEETIELDQFEVHRAELHDEEEYTDYDAIIAVNKMEPEFTHFMYVDIVRTSSMEESDLDRCARWVRYFSLEDLHEQDIFGRALREFNFLRF